MDQLYHHILAVTIAITLDTLSLSQNAAANAETYSCLYATKDVAKLFPILSFFHDLIPSQIFERKVFVMGDTYMTFLME